MRNHLQDHDIAAVLSGQELDPAAAAHLESCVACRREIERLTGLVEDRRRELESQAPDWQQQQHAVMARLPAPEAVRTASLARWRRGLLAAAAAVVVAVGIQQLWPPSAPVEVSSEREIPVEQILAEVDAVLADESLPGFESIDPGVEDLESMFDNGAS